MTEETVAEAAEAAEEGEAEEAVDEESNPGYESSTSTYKSKAPNGEGDLEEIDYDNIDELIDTLMGEEAEVEEPVERGKVSAHKGRTDYEWADAKKYSERVRHMKRPTAKGIVKGAYKLAEALIEPSTEKNPYDSIDEDNADSIYIPGALQVPRNVRPFVKALGKEVAYMKSTDIDELHNLIRYAKEKNGYVQVCGLSDGGDVIDRYIEKYGDTDVDNFLVVASNPLKSKSSKVVYINGSKDRMTIAEKQHTFKDDPDRVWPNLHEIDGAGHVQMAKGYDANRKIAEIAKLHDPGQVYRRSMNAMGTTLLKPYQPTIVPGRN